jgi:hypothetical protein
MRRVRLDGSHIFDGSQIDGNRPRRGHHGRRDLRADQIRRHPIGRPGHAHGRDDIAGMVADGRRQAAHALLALLIVDPVTALADHPQFLQEALRRRDRVRREGRKLLSHGPRLDLRLGRVRQQRLAEAGAIRRQDRPGARPHEAGGIRRQHALEIDDLPVIQNRNLRRLARRVAQRDQVRMGRLAQVEAARHDVPEHEALDAELIGAVVLRQKAGLLERGQQPEGGGARNAGPRGEIGQGQARLAEGEDAQELQRLGGGVDGVARRRQHRGPALPRRHLCRHPRREAFH